MSRPDRERIRAVRETVYNLFVLISDDGLVRSLGAVAHELGGSDESKLRMLQAAVDEDLPTAQAFPVPHRFVTVIERLGAVDSIEGAISFDSYSERFRDGSHLDLFEELLQKLDAPPDPLVCITPVLRGEPVIDGITRFGIGPLT
jgi:hypothetical protein